MHVSDVKVMSQGFEDFKGGQNVLSRVSQDRVLVGKVRNIEGKELWEERVKIKTMLSYDLKIILKILAFTLIWETSGEF